METTITKLNPLVKVRDIRNCKVIATATAAGMTSSKAVMKQRLRGVIKEPLIICVQCSMDNSVMNNISTEPKYAPLAIPVLLMM